MAPALGVCAHCTYTGGNYPWSNSTPRRDTGMGSCNSAGFRSYICNYLWSKTPVQQGAVYARNYPWRVSIYEQQTVLLNMPRGIELSVRVTAGLPVVVSQWVFHYTPPV